MYALCAHASHPDTTDDPATLPTRRHYSHHLYCVAPQRQPLVIPSSLFAFFNNLRAYRMRTPADKKKSLQVRSASIHSAPKPQQKQPLYGPRVRVVCRTSFEKNMYRNRHVGFRKALLKRVYLVCRTCKKDVQRGFEGPLRKWPEEVGDPIFTRVTQSEATSAGTGQVRKDSHFSKAPKAMHTLIMLMAKEGRLRQIAMTVVNSGRTPWEKMQGDEDALGKKLKALSQN